MISHKGNTPAFAFNHAKVIFESGEGEALNVDFCVPAGAFCCVTGDNGSGKSTLLRVACALYVPSSGAAGVFGADTRNDASLAQLRRDVAFVFQNPDDSAVAPDVLSEVAFTCENMGLARAEIVARTDRALGLVGISNLKGRLVAELSGGQRQLVALAAAIAATPRALVLDEPTAMLDGATAARVIDVLCNLNKGGTTILAATHDPAVVACATQKIHLDAGKIRYEKSAIEYACKKPDKLHQPVHPERGGLESKPVGCEGRRKVEPAATKSASDKSDKAADPVHPERGGLESKPVGCEGRRKVEPAATKSASDKSDKTADPVHPERGGLESKPVGCEGSAKFWLCQNFAPSVPAPENEVSPSPSQAKCAEAVLRFCDVGFRYPGGAEVLTGVSFELFPGQIIAVLGECGSGKSTLLKLAAGILNPTHGRVEHAGARPLFAIAKGLRRKKRTGRSARNTQIKVRTAQNPAQVHGILGYAMQTPERQLFAQDVLTDVSFGPRNLGAPANEAHAHAENALGTLGLDPHIFGSRSPFKLSGGEQRRVALAGILALDPRVLVLDEPTSALDAKAARELAALLRQLSNSGRAILLATHDAVFARAIGAKTLTI